MVGLVQEEVPIQIRPRRHPVEGLVMGRLIIRKELDRHHNTPKADNNDPRRL